MMSIKKIELLQLLFLITSLPNFNASKVEYNCNMVEDKSPRLKLKRHLFCDYHPDIRPTIDDQKNKTLISIIIIPKLANFDDMSHTLELQTWMYITWKDAFLKWDPTNYGKVDTLWVPSTEIWTPDLSIQNSGDGEYRIGVPYTNCIISKDGSVVCTPAVVFNLRCLSDYQHWPFDQQNCNVEISSWSHSSEEISFNMVKFAIVMIHFYPNPEWKITPGDIEFEQRKSKYDYYQEFPTAVIKFTVKRSYSVYWKIFITPMFVMIILTLTTLWLDPGAKERPLVACTNLIFHLICIQGLHWQIPESGINIPNILIFYHNSIILSTIALITTCFLRMAIKFTTPPPHWINFCISTILSRRACKIFLLSVIDLSGSTHLVEDGNDQTALMNSGDEQDHKTKAWSSVIVVFGSLLFFSFLFTYIIMLAIFLHIPSS